MQNKLNTQERKKTKKKQNNKTKRRKCVPNEVKMTRRRKKS